MGIVKGEPHTDGCNSSHPMTRVHARLVHLPPHMSCCRPSLSSIVASDVGKIIQISGTVVRAGAVQMYESTRAYRCREKGCGHAFVVYADLEQVNNALPVPLVCPAGGAGRDSCKGTKFDVIPNGSVHTDYQEIKIQEAASRLGIGTIPRSVLIKLQHDLVDTCQPGDDIVVVGSLISQWQPVTGNLDCKVSMSLRAHSIRIVNSEDHSTWDASINADGRNGGNGTIREELRREFDEFWSSAESKACPIAARNFICRAVCPKLYGMHIIKLALLVTLIGGSSASDDKKMDERVENNEVINAFSDDDGHDDDDIPDQFSFNGGLGLKAKSTCAEHAQYGYDGKRRRNFARRKAVQSRRRDQPHLLLVGDPGTGKSQFLRFAAALCPRSVLTTGVGTTSAGLTCAAVREGSGKEFTLEAGALVLADKGVCCIDEFGCIRQEDRTTIHEAMEQQTLSIAKAGIVCKLNCRATVIAVTNPRGGLYETGDTLAKNTGIDTPLLSRFDLIFTLIDSSDATRDNNIAWFLLDRAIQGSGYECSTQKNTGHRENWSMEKLRAYISTVKERFNPTISHDAAYLLEEHYRMCREYGQTTVHVTVRFFESLIRLSQAHARLMYRDIVLLEDAAAVILMMECSAATSYGFNPPLLDDPRDFLYQDPMQTIFPEGEEADFRFLCEEYNLLRRYGMLDRIAIDKRTSVERATNLEANAASSSYHSTTSRNSTWEGVERAQDASRAGVCSTLAAIPSQYSKSCQQIVEHEDHYGRKHFSPQSPKAHFRTPYHAASPGPPSHSGQGLNKRNNTMSSHENIINQVQKLGNTNDPSQSQKVFHDPLPIEGADIEGTNKKSHGRLDIGCTQRSKKRKKRSAD